MKEKRNPKNNKKTSQDIISMQADMARGRAAFERILPRITSLDDEELAAVTTNIAAGALAAIGVAAEISKADILQRFELLPPELFDIAHVHDLKDMAWGTLHAARMADQARYLQSRARIPADVLEEATEVEARMQACCEYHLGDHPTAGPELARLSPGHGHTDLADDLLGYATLYEKHRDVLEKDPKHYRATDLADAIRLGDEIYAILGHSHTKQTASATNQANRAWTLLLRSYSEVSETGRWLFRHDAATAERLFPSLFTVGRNNRPRSRDDEPAEAPAIPPAPTEPTEATQPLA